MDTDVYYITALAFGPDGKLYMGAEDYTTSSRNLYRFDNGFDPQGKTTLLQGATCGDITSLAWDPSGNLWIGDNDNCVSALSAGRPVLFTT